VAEAVLVYPGDLDTPTGGYAYDREVLARLAAHGVAAFGLSLPSGYPFPDQATLGRSAALLAGLPRGAVLVIDGLAFGAMPEALVAGLPHPIVALVHHPLAHEDGLSDEAKARLFASEQAALAHARAVIVTSATTAGALVAEYGVPQAAITVAEPGTARADGAACAGDPPHIVAVGSLTPRKGHDVLIEALALVSDLPWRATIAGTADRDSTVPADLARRIAAHGLQGRITLAGALDRPALDALYADADLFALASRYEGYGMVFAEAMARGLPIVASGRGAVPLTVPASAGLVVEPDDAPAFAAALRLMLSDKATRRRFADGAFAHARVLPTWDDTAGRIAALVKRVAA
jgi:glycosyltransferase involved in cell wall biosynthesis